MSTDGLNTNPPIPNQDGNGQFGNELADCINRAIAAQKQIIGVDNSVNKKIYNAANKAVGNLNSVLGVLGGQTANAAQTGFDGIQSVMGDIKTAIAGTAAGAMETAGAVAAAALGQPQGKIPQLQLDCTDPNVIVCLNRYAMDYLYQQMWGWAGDKGLQAAATKSANDVCQVLTSFGVNCPGGPCSTYPGGGRYVDYWAGTFLIALSSPHDKNDVPPPAIGSVVDYLNKCGLVINEPPIPDQPPDQPPDDTQSPPDQPPGPPTVPPVPPGQPPGPPTVPPVPPPLPPGQPPVDQPPPVVPWPPYYGPPPVGYTPPLPPVTGPGGPPTGPPYIPPTSPPGPPTTTSPGPTTPPVTTTPGPQPTPTTDPCAKTDLCIPSHTSEQPPSKTPDKQWYGVCQGDGTVQTTQDPSKYVGDNDNLIYGPYANQGTAYQYASEACFQRTQDDNEEKHPRKFPTFELPSPFFPLSVECDVSKLASASGIIEVLQNAKPQNLIEAALKAETANLNNLYDGVKSLPLVGGLVECAKNSTINPFVAYAATIPIVARMVNCEDEQFSQLFELLWNIKYFSSKADIDIDAFTAHIRYALNSRCRQIQLPAEDALSAWLANAIDGNHLADYFAIHGHCNANAKIMTETRREKLTPIDLAILLRRGKIDPQTYANEVRTTGFVRNVDADRIFELTEQRPGPTDIVRFMVRDADDKDIVEGLGLDDLFQQKYSDKLKQWAADQGVTDEQMLYNWRSHWTIPGPDMLFTFWQRLRRNAQFGTPEQQRAKIEKALIHNDILPTWHDSYFAVQYNPLGRRDLQRAFFNGKIDRKGINDGFAAIGYSDKDCDTLEELSYTLKMQQGEHIAYLRDWVKFAIDGDTLNAKLDELGYDATDKITLRTAVEQDFASSAYAKAFLKGTITGQELSDRLTNHGVNQNSVLLIIERLSLLVDSTPDVDDYKIGTKNREDTIAALSQFGVDSFRANQIIRRIDDDTTRSRITACTVAIRRRYLTGDIDTAHAIDALVKAGIAMERANEFVDGWACLQTTKGKVISAGQVCKLYRQGLISSDDMINRLDKLGYSHEDSLQVYASCQSDIDTKQQQQLIRDQLQKERQQKQKQKAIEQAAAKIARQNAAAIKASEAAKKAKKNRDAQLLAAANRVEKKCQCDYVTSITAVQDMIEELKSHFVLGLDDALVLVVKTAESWGGGAISDWQNKCRVNAELLLAEPMPADSSTLVNSQ